MIWTDPAAVITDYPSHLNMKILQILAPMDTNDLDTTL